MDAIRFVSSIQSLFPGYNAGKPSCMYICIHILTKGASGITFTVLESFRYMSLAFLAYNAINLVAAIMVTSFLCVSCKVPDSVRLEKLSPAKKTIYLKEGCMNSENITIENVLEIFSDFLDQSNDFEVVETKKMGVLTILDGSESKDRSELSIERVQDAEDLARQLLWFEISGYFYAENKHTTDPWESDEAVQNHVMMRILPRLNQLPESWGDVFYEFFSDPDDM